MAFDTKEAAIAYCDKRGLAYHLVPARAGAAQDSRPTPTIFVELRALASGKVVPAELGGRLRFADIRLVIGTRPEAIKLAPVAQCPCRARADPTLVFTGQHAALDAATISGWSAFRAERIELPGRGEPAPPRPCGDGGPSAAARAGARPPRRPRRHVERARRRRSPRFTAGRAGRACRGGTADPRSAAALARGGISHRDRRRRRAAVRADRKLARPNLRAEQVARRNPRHREHVDRCGACDRSRHCRRGLQSARQTARPRHLLIAAKSGAKDLRSIAAAMRRLAKLRRSTSSFIPIPTCRGRDARAPR